MALTTLAAVQAIPGMALQSIDFLNSLITQMSQAVKTYCKQEIESQTLTEYYSGSNQIDLVLRQLPVRSIENLWIDQTGRWGQGPNAFAAGTLQTEGTQYALILDSGGIVSNRGLVRMIAGSYSGFGWGWYQGGNWNNKLAGTQMPVWPYGAGNIKVEYAAGYVTVPADLQYATNMMIAYAVRNLPSGAPLANESLGQYSYGVVSNVATGMVPELGSLAVTLAHYRETSI